MFVDLMVRRRAVLGESVRELNFRLIDRWVNIPGFWSGNAHDARLRVSIEGDAATLDLTNCLHGMSGQVIYAARSAGNLARDRRVADDFLSLRLDTQKLDYSAFCIDTLPNIIDIFHAYKAYVVTDESVLLSSIEAFRRERLVTGRDVDGRDSVGRIWPVTYFDETLCRRSFDISVETAVSRVAQECEVSKLLAGGAYFIVTREIVKGVALEDLNNKMMGILRREE